jgi:phospholipase C
MTTTRKSGNRAMEERAILALCLAALIPACGGPGGDPAGAPAESSSQQTPTNPPIQKVFVILKSRHSYDNFFMSYPNGTPSRRVDSDGHTYVIEEPGSDHWTSGDDSWDASLKQANNGAMNGFQQPADPTSGPFVSMGVTPETGRRRLPYYWWLADRGVLSDHWFAFQFGPNGPNLIAALAASSGGAISNPAGGSFEVLDPSTGQRSTDTHFGSSRIPKALPVALEQAGLTWTIFQESGASVELASAASSIDAVRSLPDFDRRVIRSAALDQELPGLLARGAAGNVVFIQPGDPNNELPVTSEVASAERWTWSIVNAIGNSADWAHSAILILWDTAGAYYDRVAPPKVDGFGMGFRVPCLIVSPYARKGVVQSTVREHSSIARFCEALFGLATLTARDAAADNLLGAFDFGQTPRPYSDFVPPPWPADPGIETFPDEGRAQVPVGTVVAYQTDPPTSGNHYPDPEPGGFYTTPIAAGFLVHSMARGGVIIYYDPSVVSAGDLDGLRALAGLHPGLQSQVCCVPRTDASDPVILTAWTHRLRLPGYDGLEIQNFVNGFLGRGPE